ncbi:MAG TPA: endolytic transglycosylase MltG [Bacillota bacterium]|nr:endolytic transglycosylase MltG [Bacillota bacterium]HQJ36847.1 endolytic transglycosylase MltG [Bacillota bacterium]HQL35645.1 endolytic transglycosylase MltG [Bacillota bacterium]HRS21363.1 endolytic transglycosylase MltG [Clostridia bacterium]
MGNYNLKNIMLGLGIGLVLSSMINISAGSKELTLEEIKKEAQKHGLVVFSKEEIIDSQNKDNTSLIEKITVEIKSGMNSESIAALLRQKGIIDNSGAFIDKLKKADKETKLKEGTYEIPKGAGYDEIISILTK